MKPLLRRGLFVLAAVLLALLGLLGLLAGLWVWSGNDSSLAVALQQAQRVLPAGQTLETREVSGSLRHGGRIGWLRWQSGGLSVEAHEVSAAWAPAALLRRELQLSQLTMARLVIHDQREPTPATASPPPTDWRLPFRVDAAVRVDTLEWVGVSTQRLDKLSGHYMFDGQSHKLESGQGVLSSNTYRFSGELEASGPMALQLQAGGVVDAPVPGNTVPLRLDALARITGALAGPQAELVVQADLTPQVPADAPPAAGSPTPPAAMQASLSAHIAPWQVQKIIRANGSWQALNLASLWPQAPQTGLTGQASVSPQGPGWQAEITLDNSLSGPWDQQRLPLQQMQAGLTYTDGHWLLQHLQAQAAGGRVEGRGQIGTGTSTDAAGLWQGEAQVQGINPAAIDTRLASDAISGTLSARQTPASDTAPSTGQAASPGLATTFSFDIALQSGRQRATQRASNKGDLPGGLHFNRLLAQGVWSAPQLSLSTVSLDVDQAQLQGQLKLNTTSLATQGQLSLQLPGLQAQVNGHAAPTDGLGTLSVQLQDAAQASQWLQRWPGLGSQLANLPTGGTATLAAQWQGGWQQNGQAMRVDAKLQVPQLNWVTAGTQPPVTTRLQDARLNLSGRISQLAVSSHGQWTQGTQQAEWQTQASAGRGQDGHWQASLRQLQLALRQPGHANPWQLQIGAADGATPGPLTPPVTLRWQSNTSTLAVSAGTARLRGPLPGTAGISWQAAQWSPAAGPRKPAQWRSQGRIDGVPLAWLDSFTDKSLADLGISSNLLLAGSWDAASTDMLHLRATLERSAGDVRLQADAGRSTAVPAGMQEAWLQVNLDGEQVAGTLRWDSQRAGKALAAFSTRLRHDNNGWAWPDSAPLGGSLQLQLPPVDAWSALAPPGWRLRGTVDSHIDLMGTRAQPEWAGTLRARDLAVRSVVDGIDFSQGTLDARLHGQQLDIQNFTLRGAGTPQDASAGGQLSITGSVVWLAKAGQSSPAQQVQMALQAKLSALRLSARPDRRLTASGQLQADLTDARLTLRGSLVADQALITLPDDSTPTLDDDVRVRTPATATPGKTATVAPAGAKAGGRIRTDVAVNLDLGPDFQLRGRGLQARLAGKLALTAEDGATPELIGSIRAVNGTYQAYGQRLQIQRGLIRFYGPIDNPALAILAIRPKLTQRVGVQISGTALSPVVSLYAEPSLPDVEILSWLVLGHSGSGGGAEAALIQQAALALLGGNGNSLSDSLSSALGLDELSFSAGSDASDGNTASGTSVTLGKRLSQDFYVAYESSLTSAMGMFSIFYDITRRLTLRVQTGEQSAVDLIFTMRYD